MKIFLMVTVVLGVFIIPVDALEYTAPIAPDSVQEYMPHTDSFGDGLQEMLRNAVSTLYPEVRTSWRICAGAVAAVLAVGTLQSFSDASSGIGEMVGTLVISSIMVLNANSMIQLASDTVRQIIEYGKLLVPILTAALAAQGGVSSSASLYAGTAVFNAVIGSFLSQVIRPFVYCFLTLAIAVAATGETMLKNMRDLIKSFCGWCLKIILTVFTTYMSITGVITGTTDAVALKATKVTISSFVPVVGSILSEASDAILLSAGLAKNAAGIYGIFAILAIFLVPFLRIGVHYLIIKATFGICGVFGTKRMVDLIGDFSTAMGLLLAMIGSACLIQLVSTACFMKGIG